MIFRRKSVWADLVTVVKHTVDKHWNEIESYKKIKDSNSNLIDNKKVEAAAEQAVTSSRAVTSRVWQCSSWSSLDEEHWSRDRAGPGSASGASLRH